MCILAFVITVSFSRRKKERDDATPQVTPQVIEYDSKTARLLEFCETARSLQEMMQFLDLTDRKHFRRRYLNPLLDTGVIRMTIPDKPRSSQQKYVVIAVDRGKKS